MVTKYFRIHNGSINCLIILMIIRFSCALSFGIVEYFTHMCVHVCVCACVRVCVPALLLRALFADILIVLLFCVATTKVGKLPMCMGFMVSFM